MDEDVAPVNATDHTPYVCAVEPPDADADCPYSCIGLSQCSDCHCAVVAPGSGPWGKIADVAFCLLPILFLVLVTMPPRGMMKKPMGTTQSLPLSALLLLLVRLMYLGSDPLLVCASVVKGVHEALTPLSIMAGAICLFETMEATRCLPYMMREMKALTGGHPVAELCVIYSFAMMVEGASGFGTRELYVGKLSMLLHVMTSILSAL